MNFNKFTQKLFWWTNTGKDAATGRNFANAGDAQQSENLVNIALQNTQKNLESIHNKISGIKGFYLSEMMISRIIDDALNTVGEDEEVFKVQIVNDDGSENELATKESKSFKKNFNIERLITDIAPEILAYGSHYIRLDVNTSSSESALKGVINIHDDVDPSKIIPSWRDSQIVYFNKINDDGSIERMPSYNYVYFGYSNSRKKVKVDINDEEAVYFRVGEGLLHPVLNLLESLYLLEGLIYVNLLKKASKQPVLGVTVPDTVKPEEAVNISKSYEKLINKSMSEIKFDFENIKETLDDILKHSTSIKVVPSWGDKGQVEKQNYEVFEELDDLFQKVEDLRNTTLMTLGFPQSIFENEVSRMDIIQNSTRYAKKIKTFQTSLRNSIQHLFLVHLKNQGYDVSIHNIKVMFTNSYSLSDLEKIEYLNMTIDMMSTIKDFVDDTMDSAEEMGVTVNGKELIKFYNTSFEKLFDAPIFTIREDDDEDDE